MSENFPKFYSSKSIRFCQEFVEKSDNRNILEFITSYEKLLEFVRSNALPHVSDQDLHKTIIYRSFITIAYECRKLLKEIGEL